MTPSSAIKQAYIITIRRNKMYLDLPNGEEARHEQLEFELGQIYEAIAGDDAINRYTHDEIIERIYQMYDAEQKLNSILEEEV